LGCLAFPLGVLGARPAFSIPSKALPSTASILSSASSSAILNSLDAESLITMDPDICHGKPVIRGLRYPVESVLEWLASGMSHAAILEDYPDLHEEDIRACLRFAARLAHVKVLSPSSL
jgi:uncharacterized protein (DUF433 family)